MSYRYLLIFIIVFASILLIGCKEHAHDERLDQIAVSISENPEEAIFALDSIDKSTLSKSDRHYYDFLTIKANDKAYVRHASDSLYLSVLDYYNSRKKDPLYPEVLYYGGRIYSDLGDYPTALNYFQSTIDLLPQEIKNRELLDFKANVLSQTGRLLTTLCLYEEAVPYVNSSIEIDRDLKDTISLVYDMQLLGGIYYKAENYDLADHFYRETLKYKNKLPRGQFAITKLGLSDIKRKKGEIDSAILYFRNIPDEIYPASKNSALISGTCLYMENGDLDSSYYYAHKLISSTDPTNKEIGYDMILSPELKSYIPSDSLFIKISEYRKILIDKYNENENKLALILRSQYNYSLHDRERWKAEKEKAVVWDWLLGSISLILLLLVVILYYKYNNKKQQIALQNALESLSQLKLNLNIHPVEDKSLTTNLRDPDQNKEPDLRERLKKELLSLYERNKHTTLSDVIAESSAYRQIQESLEKGIAIPDDAPLWHEIERSVQEIYPDFKANLRLLTQSRLTSLDLHTALLIKCHFTPTQMSVLLGRSKGTIVSRRETLSLKIFDEKIGTKVIDGIIRLL